MRRIVLSFFIATAAIAAVVACTGQDRAGAETKKSPEVAASAIYRDASMAAAAPAVEVPVGPSLAPLIERLKPAVVNISTTTLVRSPHGRGFGRGDPLERFFGFPGPGPGPDNGEGGQGGMRGQGLGSGFILNAQGLVLTNHHVIKDATDIRLRLTDNTEYAAKVVGKDAATDVALLQIVAPPKDLPAVVLGDSDQLRQGDFVVAMGSPFGLRETATLGIVSAKHRVGVSEGTSQYDDFLQTDAAINPGNSGGPLFNLRGEVVGINTAIVSPQIGSGIGFAVPINLAKSLLPQLQAKGRVVLGYVGATVSDLSPDLARAFGLPPGSKGALVQQVSPKQPAARAGMEPGDLVVSLNGKPLDSSGALVRSVAEVPPGEKAKLVVVRRGVEKTFELTVAQRPDELVQADGDEVEEKGGEAGKSPKLGLRLQPLTPDLARQLNAEGEQGVVVAAVTDGGPAQRGGLRGGDILLELNRRPVTSPAEVVEAIGKLKEGSVVLVRVRRGAGYFFMAITLGGK
jgi:serine protease Do